MIAVLLLYKRMELAHELLEQIISLDSLFQDKNRRPFFSRIYVVHDGVSVDEDYIGKKSHKVTREFALRVDQEYANVTTLVYDKNIGLTPHIFRIVEDLGAPFSDIVFFEEDKVPKIGSYEFLETVEFQNRQCYLVDTLPLNSHKNPQDNFYNTLFTDNGNFRVSDELASIAKSLWQNPYKNHHDFQRNLIDYFDYFLEGFALRSAFRYYEEYLHWGLTNPWRTDSLLTYSLILSKSLKSCPLERLSEDRSDQDTRGKNVNWVDKKRGALCDFPLADVWNYKICFICESQGVAMRAPLSMQERIQRSLRFRINKAVNRI